MRSFAIIPAAGHSVRMGRPKLLLPWGNTTVIEHVLQAWSDSHVTELFLVLRRDDYALAEAARRFAHLVTPDIDPPEMKASIRYGLDQIRIAYQPTATDVWLLAPADLPGLTTAVIDRVLTEHRPASLEILVPFINGHRAHPVLFPWRLAEEVETLSENEGLNALVNRHGTKAIACDDVAILNDIDTPEDYERLRPGQ